MCGVDRCLRSLSSLSSVAGSAGFVGPGLDRPTGPLAFQPASCISLPDLPVTKLLQVLVCWAWLGLSLHVLRLHIHCLWITCKPYEYLPRHIEVSQPDIDTLAYSAELSAVVPRHRHRHRHRDCRVVLEKTHYIEIFNYSDPELNTSEDHLLTSDEFENFLERRGAFAPPTLKNGVRLLDGMRLVVQRDADHKDTFTTNFISLTHQQYTSMVRTFHLPFRAIEGSSLVGPAFWCEYDQDEDDRHLQFIFRKSDVRKKGKTRGWEIMLSYSFNTGITTGFVKGTQSSDINEALKHLMTCSGEVGHPMLLPMIILSHDLSAKVDIRQREARDWLRRLENAITLRKEIDEKEEYTDFDVDGINRDLVECHSQVLWKRPQAYQEIIKEMKEGMIKFKACVHEEKNTKKMKASHSSMGSRLEFYRVKLTGQEHYIHTTLERLHIQRQALYNIITQKESKLNLEMAAQQRRLAHASKRDSTAMKTLSLLGAIFLPGTFLSSVFSMTFFNFRVPDNSEVSQELWIYFAITIPLTVAIVGAWWALDRIREKSYAVEDFDIEQGIERMENEILAIMRKKTMNKASTWGSGNKSPTLTLSTKTHHHHHHNPFHTHEKKYS